MKFFANLYWPPLPVFQQQLERKPCGCHLLHLSTLGCLGLKQGVRMERNQCCSGESELEWCGVGCCRCACIGQCWEECWGLRQLRAAEEVGKMEGEREIRLEIRKSQQPDWIANERNWNQFYAPFTATSVTLFFKAGGYIFSFLIWFCKYTKFFKLKCILLRELYVDSVKMITSFFPGIATEMPTPARSPMI